MEIILHTIEIYSVDYQIYAPILIQFYQTDSSSWWKYAQLVFLRWKHCLLTIEDTRTAAVHSSEDLGHGETV